MTAVAIFSLPSASALAQESPDPIVVASTQLWVIDIDRRNEICYFAADFADKGQTHLNIAKGADGRMFIGAYNRDWPFAKGEEFALYVNFAATRMLLPAETYLADTTPAKQGFILRIEPHNVSSFEANLRSSPYIGFEMRDGPVLAYLDIRGSAANLDKVDACIARVKSAKPPTRQ